MEHENYPPVHEPVIQHKSFERLEMLWKRYPKYHEKTCFSTLEQLLEKHESYQKDFSEELEQEYREKQFEKFLIQLSWSDLAYRYGTKDMIEDAGALKVNPYVTAFMEQFSTLNLTKKACFLFPESFTSQFFVIREVCKRAERFFPINNLFPDETTIHYLSVFDKRNMDDVLLMYHLLYTNATEQVYGGYSLYEYSFPWYQNHLWQDGVVLRSPYLPDQLAKYQGNLPYYHNPSKTVYVRRNIEHILDCGYFTSELEFFRNLTEIIMPYFQWWYMDLTLYEEVDGFTADWKMEQTKIRTKLTAEKVINPKWKHELTLFDMIRKRYPDTLYQYRPDWLGRQSLDIYIPSLRIAIEYQGIQHYHPVEFFGGEEALEKRQELDQIKKRLCEENHVRLIEWSYRIPPTEDNIGIMIETGVEAIG